MKLFSALKWVAEPPYPPNFLINSCYWCNCLGKNGAGGGRDEGLKYSNGARWKRHSSVSRATINHWEKLHIPISVKRPRPTEVWFRQPFPSLAYECSYILIDNAGTLFWKPHLRFITMKFCISIQEKLLFIIFEDDSLTKCHNIIAGE